MLLYTFIILRKMFSFYKNCVLVNIFYLKVLFAFKIRIAEVTLLKLIAQSGV